MTNKSRWQQYKEKNNGVTPLDLFRSSTPKSSTELSDSRYSICEQCDKFLSMTKQCKECGCFMQLKVKLAEAQCPIGKW